MQYSLKSAVILAMLVLITPAARGIELELAQSFPEAAPGSFGIEIEALPDGRLIVWNGDTIFIQPFPEWNTFEAIASGYTGDPGFMAVSPDGNTVLLGAGYSGDLYRFDVNNPADNSAAALAANTPHYSGVFLTDSLVLLDRGSSDSLCELAVLDLAAAPPVVRSLMRKPAAEDVPAGGFAASAQLAINSDRTTVYTMAPVYDESFMVTQNQLKSVPVSALISAFNSSTTLDWTADATAIGGPTSYNSGGACGVLLVGLVVITGFGGVQLVNPESGTIIDTLSPAGFDYYGAACNPHFGDVYPIVADPSDWSMDVVYAPAGSLAPLPAASVPALLALCGTLMVAGIWRRRCA